MTKRLGRTSVREQKAEALDILVKAELARKQEFNTAKIARLKALRLAQEEQEANLSAPEPAAKRQRRTRKTLHLPRSS
jgi:hypothetical protein